MQQSRSLFQQIISANSKDESLFDLDFCFVSQPRPESIFRGICLSQGYEVLLPSHFQALKVAKPATVLAAFAFLSETSDNLLLRFGASRSENKFSRNGSRQVSYTIAAPQNCGKNIHQNKQQFKDDKKKKFQIQKKNLLNR